MTATRSLPGWCASGGAGRARRADRRAGLLARRRLGWSWLAWRRLARRRLLLGRRRLHRHCAGAAVPAARVRAAAGLSSRRRQSSSRLRRTIAGQSQASSSSGPPPPGSACYAGQWVCPLDAPDRRSAIRAPARPAAGRAWGRAR